MGELWEARPEAEAAGLSRGQLLQILNSGFGNLFVTDSRGRICYANDSVARDMGLTRQELLTMRIQDIVEQELADTSAVLSALEEKKQVVRQVRQKKTGLTLLVMALPVFDAAGELELVVAFSQRETPSDIYRRLEQERAGLRRAYDLVTGGGIRVVAESRAMRQVLRLARQAAFADSTMMLYGESGTGKEVLARYIHQNSPRAGAIFVPVNCAAIPRELMEAEFFGYERGAFTGASREGKLGLFEVADGGTLFLDEVGELSPPLQSKLLRVLESGELKRVGGNRIRKTNTRIIAATNRDLSEMVEKGEFRADLYYRLNVIPLRLPPLRSRQEDILPLAVSFLEYLNKKYGADKLLTTDAFEPLLRYPWPGNVRELKNFIERLFVTTEGHLLTGEDVARTLGDVFPGEEPGERERPRRRTVLPGAGVPGTLREATEAFQREQIEAALAQCGGSVTRAARQLGLHRSGLYKKMQKLGIPMGEEPF